MSPVGAFVRFLFVESAFEVWLKKDYLTYTIKLKKYFELFIISDVRHKPRRTCQILSKGSSSFTSHNYLITYDLYEQLFDTLSHQGINTQEAMALLLPQIN